MSVDHADILQLLCPVPWIMTDAERAVYGAALDRTRARLEALTPEMFPDTAVELLSHWEGLYQMVPVPGASIGQRQQAVAARYRATGDIKIPYFVAMARAMNYRITIATANTAEAGQDFTAGVSGADDTLGYTEDPIVPYVWIVTILAPYGPINPYFNLLATLEDLKPAHRTLQFNDTN
jgi:uncharacterized protein YmfQ (DUF2313 family)